MVVGPGYHMSEPFSKELQRPAIVDASDQNVRMVGLKENLGKTAFIGALMSTPGG